ncbi:hypothetical protein AAZX31_02G282100 [Glycine max]
MCGSKNIEGQVTNRDKERTRHWDSGGNKGHKRFELGRKELRKKNNKSSKKVDAIGNTPLMIRINSLSAILGKCEFLNPGGSVNDRVAVHIIQEALESDQLRPDGIVTEGSAGSTAISIATIAPAYGCRTHVVIPDDAAIEKSQILEALGATVERVRPVSITHKDHFFALKRTNSQQLNGKEDTEKINGYESDGCSYSSLFPEDCQGGFFADQFENLANFRAHYEGTGPEICSRHWWYCGWCFKVSSGSPQPPFLHVVDVVVLSVKVEKNPNIKCFLVDPPGSGLFNRVTRAVMYTKEEADGRRLKNPFDTITEGIGINRITRNFAMAKLDGAFRGTDREAVEMSRFLLKNDGLFLGSSSAMNCVGAVRVAQAIGPGHTIVTILCDSGMRHLSKFYDAEYLSLLGLTPKATGLELLGIK